MQCRFAGCNATFQNAYAQRAHHRSHTGDTPWECDTPGCVARFAVRRALAAHKQAEHPAGRADEARPPPLGELERTGVLEEGEKAERVGVKNADAEEIAKNCAYFVTQLHAARVRSAFRIDETKPVLQRTDLSGTRGGCDRGKGSRSGWTTT